MIVLKVRGVRMRGISREQNVRNVAISAMNVPGGRIVPRGSSIQRNRFSMTTKNANYQLACEPN